MKKRGMAPGDPARMGMGKKSGRGKKRGKSRK